MAQMRVRYCINSEECVFILRERNTAWVCQLAKNDRLEHRHRQINREDAATWRLEARLTEGARIRKEQQIVLLGQHH